MDEAPDHATAARAAHPAAERSRLIFFVGADPNVDPGPVEAARHMATVAGEAGLEGEIRLATGAVRALEMGMLEGLPETISLTACPRSKGNLDLSEERARAAGAPAPAGGDPHRGGRRSVGHHPHRPSRRRRRVTP